MLEAGEIISDIEAKFAMFTKKLVITMKFKSFIVD